MGQSAIDLPDPLEQPSRPGRSGAAASRAPATTLDKNFSNADDLLSQLASEEIDRLLAEAESGLPAAPVTAPAEGSESEAKSAEIQSANSLAEVVAHRIDGSVQPVKPPATAEAAAGGKPTAKSAAKPVP